MLPSLLSQFPDGLKNFGKDDAAKPAAADDDVPDLVENFEDASKKEE